MSVNVSRRPPLGVPFGVIVVAILRMVDAATIAAIAVGLRPIELTRIPAPLDDPRVVAVVGLTWAAIGVAGAIGLLLLQRWGWVTSMIMVGLGLAAALIREVRGAPDHLVLLLLVVSAFYLNQRSVRALAGGSIAEDDARTPAAATAADRS